LIFDYSQPQEERRHGPANYAAYESYRPWLRDEFDFRCVYCLKRETWCEILGRFYRDNKDKSSVEAKEAGNSYFAEYSRMVRPIADAVPMLPRGTAEDRMIKAVFSGSAREAFAATVCVRTGKHLHGALLPFFTKPDSAAAYVEFMKNDREEIWMEDFRYEVDKDEWHATGAPIQSIWPKEAAARPRRRLDYLIALRFSEILEFLSRSYWPVGRRSRLHAPDQGEAAGRQTRAESQGDCVESATVLWIVRLQQTQGLLWHRLAQTS
jgi:hypothetical protein